MKRELSDFDIDKPVMLLLTAFALVASASAGHPHHALSGGDVGDPLFLTPLIEAGKLDEARNLSRCGPLPNAPPLESYSGYVTVNKTYNSNMFFWFFPHVSVLAFLDNGLLLVA